MFLLHRNVISRQGFGSFEVASCILPALSITTSARMFDEGFISSCKHQINSEWQSGSKPRFFRLGSTSRLSAPLRRAMQIDLSIDPHARAAHLTFCEVMQCIRSDQVDHGVRRVRHPTQLQTTSSKLGLEVYLEIPLDMVI